MFAYFLWRCRVPDFGGRCDPGYVRTALAEDRRQCPKVQTIARFRKGLSFIARRGRPFPLLWFSDKYHTADLLRSEGTPNAAGVSASFLEGRPRLRSGPQPQIPRIRVNQPSIHPGSQPVTWLSFISHRSRPACIGAAALVKPVPFLASFR